MQSVMMPSGKVFSGEKIDKVVAAIINKLADEELNVSEAKIVLNEATERIEESAQVKFITDSSCEDTV